MSCTNVASLAICFEFDFDGTPYAMKVARTVWSGGKTRDYLKGLPITIIYRQNREKINSFSSIFSMGRDSRKATSLGFNIKKLSSF